MWDYVSGLRRVGGEPRMPVFVVVVKRGAERAAKEIDRLPDDTVYQLADNSWLIDYDGTTRTLAENIKVRGDDAGITGIVFLIDSYSGRFATDAWEWLGLHTKDKPV
jgi:hypothetical protein